MKDLKNEIEMIGGNLLETSDGIFVRAYNEREIREIQSLLRKYPRYSLGSFVECDLYGFYYYEAVLIKW